MLRTLHLTLLLISSPAAADTYQQLENIFADTTTQMEQVVEDAEKLCTTKSEEELDHLACQRQLNIIKTYTEIMQNLNKILP